MLVTPKTHAPNLKRQWLPGAPGVPPSSFSFSLRFSGTSQKRAVGPASPTSFDFSSLISQPQHNPRFEASGDMES
jgi:hypothetical protein